MDASDTPGSRDAGGSAEASGTLLLLTENQGWGGAAVYLRELLLAVAPLYDRVVVVANPGGLDVGDLPSRVLSQAAVEHFDIRYPSRSDAWRRFSHISGKLTLLAWWFLGIYGPPVQRSIWRRLLRRHRPRAVFCANHGAQVAIWTMMEVCGRRGIPAATYLLGMPDAYDNVTPRQREKADPVMWRAARFVLVNASAVGDAHGRERGLPAEKVVVVPNGVPDDPARALPMGSSTSFTIGTLGRLSRLKGVHHLIAASSRLAVSGVPVHLAIAGDGSEANALRDLAASSGIADRVRFEGFVPDERAGEFLAGLDVFVLASLTEGLPFTVMEAMRAGLPIVASRVGGVPEMIEDGVSGILYDAGDEMALATALERLWRDPELARRLGIASRRRYEERFTLEAMHEGIRQAFVAGGLAGEMPGRHESMMGGGA